MPQAVIHHLESIKVQEQHRILPPAASCLIHAPPQPMHQQVAIRKPRQAVRQRLLLQHLLRELPLRDVKLQTINELRLAARLITHDHPAFQHPSHRTITPHHAIVHRIRAARLNRLTHCRIHTRHILRMRHTRAVPHRVVDEVTRRIPRDLLNPVAHKHVCPLLIHRHPKRHPRQVLHHRAKPRLTLPQRDGPLHQLVLQFIALPLRLLTQLTLQPRSLKRNRERLQLHAESPREEIQHHQRERHEPIPRPHKHQHRQRIPADRAPQKHHPQIKQLLVSVRHLLREVAPHPEYKDPRIRRHHTRRQHRQRNHPVPVRLPVLPHHAVHARHVLPAAREEINQRIPRPRRRHMPHMRHFPHARSCIGHTHHSLPVAYRHHDLPHRAGPHGAAHSRHPSTAMPHRIPHIPPIVSVSARIQPFLHHQFNTCRIYHNSATTQPESMLSCALSR